MEEGLGPWKIIGKAVGFWKITGKTVADFAQSLDSSCNVRGTWEKMEFHAVHEEEGGKSSGIFGEKGD